MRQIWKALALGLALSVGMGAALTDRSVQAYPPGEKAVSNTHTGIFMSGNGHEFKMKSEDGKEHSHTLTADAKVLNKEGKPCKLSDIKSGEKIRVTTKEGDIKTAVKVECLS